MISIAYVINRIENGGPSNVIRNILKSIDLDKYNVYIITLFLNKDDLEVVEEIYSIGVKIINLGYTSNFDCFFSKNRLIKVLKNNKIRIVHSHGFLPDFLSSNNKTKCTRISTLHCRLFEDYPDVYGKKSIIYIKMHISFLRKMDRVVGCSKSVYQQMKSYIPNITYIENGIDMATSNSLVTRTELNLPEKGVIYIYTGQLRERKNVIWLIKEFIKYHCENEYLVILGKGVDKTACENVSDENVYILGFKKNVKDFLKVSDIFISASKSEGFSISVLEALENGLGLFLSNIPSHAEVFEIDDNYYLGECFGYNEFEKKLNLLRINSNKLSKQKIKEFKDKYLSAKHMMNCYEKIYEDALEKINDSI